MLSFVLFDVIIGTEKKQEKSLSNVVADFLDKNLYYGDYTRFYKKDLQQYFQAFQKREQDASRLVFSKLRALYESNDLQ